MFYLSGAYRCPIRRYIRYVCEVVTIKVFTNDIRGFIIWFYFDCRLTFLLVLFATKNNLKNHIVLLIGLALADIQYYEIYKNRSFEWPLNRMHENFWRPDTVFSFCFSFSRMLQWKLKSLFLTKVFFRPQYQLALKSSILIGLTFAVRRTLTLIIAAYLFGLLYLNLGWKPLLVQFSSAVTTSYFPPLGGSSSCPPCPSPAW